MLGWGRLTSHEETKGVVAPDDCSGDFVRSL